MNIKSLLLGSAAALVAVPAAQAADAIIFAEPEPTEYVRICDTYGAGFYYIPGTETCLRVGGYLRYDIGVGDLFGIPSIDKSDVADFLAGNIALGDIGDNDTYFTRARFALRVDARSETELGTLRGYAHINFNYDTHEDGIRILGLQPGLGDFLPFSTADDAVGIEWAFIELGGFRVGKVESMFSAFTNYAGDVINDDLVSYGPLATHQISYTFSGGNGFTAAIALEDGRGGNLLSGTALSPFISVDAYTIDSYMPHVVAGVGFEQAWGGVRAVVGYDSVHSEWAAKIRGDVNFGAGALFLMAGFKDGDERFNYYGQWGGDWALWGGASFDVTENAAINVQLSYDDSETFAAVANVAWSPVENFTITPEIAYVSEPGEDAWGGYLRFQRSF